MEGITESKKVIADAMDIAIVVAKLTKDGIQIGDALALFGDDKFKAAVAELAKSVGAVPKELGDLDLSEGLELGMIAVMKVPELLAALKK